MGVIRFQWCAFDSAISHVIEWGTQATVGHIDIILPDGSLLGAQHEDGLGGMPAGVQIRPANYGDTSGMINRMRVDISVPDDVEKDAYDWALSMVGTPYDTRAIIGIMKNEDWSTPGHLICSGFGSGMLTQPTKPVIVHKLPKPWRIMTPEEHLILCSALGEVYAYV